MLVARSPMASPKSPLGVIYFTVFISMIGFGIVIPVLPVYAKSEPFLLNPTQLGWLVGIFSLVQLFSAPIIGKLSDRFGRKPVLLVSIIGTAIGYFVTGAAYAPWMLFLGRMIDGASGGNDFVGKPFNFQELSVKALTLLLKAQLHIA